jgi:hypothetical protein
MSPAAIKRYVNLRMICPLFLHNFKKFGFFQQTFKNVPNIKFYRNPFIESHADICGRKDVTTAIGAFRELVNAPENTSVLGSCWDLAHIVTELLTRSLQSTDLCQARRARKKGKFVVTPVTRNALYHNRKLQQPFVFHQAWI